MNKTNLLWLTAVAVHTYLFYNQVQGYNAPVFSLVLIVLVGAAHRALLSFRYWWMGATMQLIAAIAVAWHVSGWLQTIYVCSLFVFVGLTYAPRSSLHLAWLNGLVGAFLGGFATHLPVLRKEFSAQTGKTFQGLFRFKPSFLVFPFSVTTAFYFLYNWANPAFSVDFSFFTTHINFLFIGAILIGMVWLCPLFFPWGIESAVEEDSRRKDELVRVRKVKKGILPLMLRYQNQQGVLLFGMLNALISCFILFNVLQMLIPDLQQTPKGFSEQVHEGFNALLISVLVAIWLIMYYFKANQNFYPKRKRLVQLALLWIALNGLLTVFTFYKNALYIDVFGLTFKRIWVYMALGLTFGGLLFTFIKIIYLKSNWYLIRRTSWLVYGVLICYGLVDWDRLITWYNIKEAKNLDMDYITELGPTKLPYLQELIQQKDARIVGSENKIKTQIKNWKYNHREREDWQSRTVDEDWLRKIMIEQ
jgi:hypothetical protein